MLNRIALKIKEYSLISKNFNNSIISYYSAQRLKLHRDHFQEKLYSTKVSIPTAITYHVIGLVI